jgi:hypothetical protein
MLCRAPIGLNDFARLESKGRSRGITREEFKELLISAELTEIKKLYFTNLFRSPTLALRKKIEKLFLYTET